jgi:hypothetical protein
LLLLPQAPHAGLASSQPFVVRLLKMRTVIIIAVCKTLGTAATSLLFEHNARARVFGLFLDNHCMDPLHSLIKSEPFYYLQVLVTKKSTIHRQIITSISVPFSRGF